MPLYCFRSGLLKTSWHPRSLPSKCQQNRPVLTTITNSPIGFQKVYLTAWSPIEVRGMCLPALCFRCGYWHFKSFPEHLSSKLYSWGALWSDLPQSSWTLSPHSILSIISRQATITILEQCVFSQPFFRLWCFQKRRMDWNWVPIACFSVWHRYLNVYSNPVKWLVNSFWQTRKLEIEFPPSPKVSHGKRSSSKFQIHCDSIAQALAPAPYSWNRPSGAGSMCYLVL